MKNNRLLRACVVAQLALAVGAAWLLNRSANPKTQVRPVSNPLVIEVFPWRTMCAGIQCLACGFQCFLPEGFTGECAQRMNQGGKAVSRINPISP